MCVVCVNVVQIEYPLLEGGVLERKTKRLPQLPVPFSCLHENDLAPAIRTWATCEKCIVLVAKQFKLRPAGGEEMGREILNIYSNLDILYNMVLSGTIRLSG